MKQIEKDVLFVFEQHFSIPQAQIHKAYKKLKSFDSLYKILEMVNGCSQGTLDALDAMTAAIKKDKERNGKPNSKEA